MGSLRSLIQRIRITKSKDLEIPENLRLIRLPAYSPELNPQEHVWDDLREKAFPNRVSTNMEEGLVGSKPS